MQKKAKKYFHKLLGPTASKDVMQVVDGFFALMSAEVSDATDTGAPGVYGASIGVSEVSIASAFPEYLEVAIGHELGHWLEVVHRKIPGRTWDPRLNSLHDALGNARKAMWNQFKHLENFACDSGCEIWADYMAMAIFGTTTGKKKGEFVRREDVINAITPFCKGAGPPATKPYPDDDQRVLLFTRNPMAWDLMELVLEDLQATSAVSKCFGKSCFSKKGAAWTKQLPHWDPQNP